MAGSSSRAGALMTCVGMGAMFSLAVFLQPMSERHRLVAHRHLERRRRSTSSCMGVAALRLGRAVSDRFGTRIVVLLGGVLLGPRPGAGEPGDHACSQFQLVFGVLVGVAAGAFYAPMMALATRWFEQQPQPRGGAGLGRHGRGAADDRAVRALADHDLRLAHRDAGHRHRRLGRC